MELKRVIQFLEKEGWSEKKANDKYVFYEPPQTLGFQEGYTLPIPILLEARDFDIRLSNTIDSLADIYETNVENLFYDVGDYLEILRKDAIYFKINSKEVMYNHTLELDYIAQFLRNLNFSYSNYIKVKFARDFSATLKNKVDKIATRIANLSQLRLVDLQYQSFSFGVSADIMMGNEKIDIEEIASWRKEVVPRYKKEVIDIDYDSKDDLGQILETFSKEERKQIFDPLIKVINNNNYEVALTNSKFQKTKIYSKIPKSTLDVILPIEQEEEKAPVFEMLQIIVPVDKSQSKLTLKVKDLQHDLFSAPIEEFSARVAVLEHNGQEVLLTPPIEVAVKYDATARMFIAKLETLNYERKAETMKDIQKSIKKDMQGFFDRYNYLKKKDAASLSKEDKMIDSFFEEIQLTIES